MVDLGMLAFCKDCSPIVGKTTEDEWLADALESCQVENSVFTVSIQRRIMSSNLLRFWI